MGNGNWLSSFLDGGLTGCGLFSCGAQSILPQSEREKFIWLIIWLKLKPFFILRLRFFFLFVCYRACCGWNRIILLSFWDWRSYFSVHFRLFANYFSILTIRGKFIIFLVSFFSLSIRPRLIDWFMLSVGFFFFFCCGFLDVRWGWVNMFGFCLLRSSPSY